MTIHVTQEHIDNGTAKSCEFCPISNAIHEATGRYVMTHAMRAWIACKWHDLPVSVFQFILAFDRGDRVKPFSFELDYEPEGAE